MPITDGDVCWKCGNLEDAPAGAKCTNPRWHLPNWQTFPAPPEGQRRDYVAELARAWKHDADDAKPIDPDAEHERFLQFWNASMAERLKPQ